MTRPKRWDTPALEIEHCGQWWELVTPDLPDLSAVDRASIKTRIPAWRPAVPKQWSLIDESHEIRALHG